MDEKTRIYLVRHAKPKILSNELNEALDEEGKKQAEEVAKFLKEKQIDLIYASPLTRARQTADRIANVCKCKIIEDPGLEELNWRVWHKNAGEWDFETARTRLEEIPLYEKQQKDLEKAQQKALREINEIYKKNKGKNIVIASHGNVIRSFITGIMGAHVIGFLSLEIALTGTSLIQVNEKGHYKIIYVNRYTHLTTPEY